MHLNTFLALGDSYTIGEGVPLFRNFPYQTIGLLRKLGHSFAAPEIIAVTGWTTSELEAGFKGYPCSNKYDFVTLLIGVNDQYRGMDAIAYKENFESLLKLAIDKANGKKDQVFVISIPDYSITPFTATADAARIAKEIDVFNSVNRAISVQYKVDYIDITPHSRETGTIPGMIVSDGLHPAEDVYAEWASMLAEKIVARLK